MRLGHANIRKGLYIYSQRALHIFAKGFTYRRKGLRVYSFRAARMVVGDVVSGLAVVVESLWGNAWVGRDRECWEGVLWDRECREGGRHRKQI